MHLILTTEGVSPRERVSYWHDVARKALTDHQCRSDPQSPFEGILHRAALGELEMLSIDTNGLRNIARSRREIARGEDDVFLLCVQLAGRSIFTQDGREASLGPGEFALLDVQRPFNGHFPGHRKQITIKIPHRMLKARLAAASELTAHAVRKSNAIGDLAAAFVAMLPSRIDALEPAIQSQMADHVLDLAATALASETGKCATPSSARALAMVRLRAAIEVGLRDPAFGPSAAAVAAGISVRYANVLLSEQGTSLERLIVQRRLERCRRALEDRAQNCRSVTDIAFAWGFHDMSHFTRRFKAAFGCSPGEFRRRGVFHPARLDSAAT